MQSSILETGFVPQREDDMSEYRRKWGSYRQIGMGGGMGWWSLVQGDGRDHVQLELTGYLGHGSPAGQIFAFPFQHNNSRT